MQRHVVAALISVVCGADVFASDAVMKGEVTAVVQMNSPSLAGLNKACVTGASMASMAGRELYPEALSVLAAETLRTHGFGVVEGDDCPARIVVSVDNVGSDLRGHSMALTSYSIEVEVFEVATTTRGTKGVTRTWHSYRFRGATILKEPETYGYVKDIPVELALADVRASLDEFLTEWLKANPGAGPGRKAPAKIQTQKP